MRIKSNQIWSGKSRIWPDVINKVHFQKKYSFQSAIFVIADCETIMIKFTKQIYLANLRKIGVEWGQNLRTLTEG